MHFKCNQKIDSFILFKLMKNFRGSALAAGVGTPESAPHELLGSSLHFYLRFKHRNCFYGRELISKLKYQHYLSFFTLHKYISPLFVESGPLSAPVMMASPTANELIIAELSSLIPDELARAFISSSDTRRWMILRLVFFMESGINRVGT